MCLEEGFQGGPQLRVSATCVVQEQLALGVGPQFKGRCEEFFLELPALVHGRGRFLVQAFKIPMRNLRTKTLSEMEETFILGLFGI